MADEETFEPCEKCGSGYVELTGNPFISGKRWVACGMCKHSGPLADTEWEAIERWNAPSRVHKTA